MFAILLTIGWFVLVLTFLVLIHELGHFLAAKYIGVDVLEFGIGYPPRAKKLFRWWKTDFTLNWFPLGGFVRLWGDDAEEVLSDHPEHAESGLTQKGMFHAKKKSQRLLVILAGVFINFLFGVLVFAGLYSYYGIPEVLPHVEVAQVLPDSPAQEVGLQEGDVLVRLVEKDGDEAQITNPQQFIELTSANAGTRVELTVRRDGEERVVEPVLRAPDTTTNKPALGIVPTDIKFVFYPWWQQPFRGMYVGLKDSLELGRLILVSLGGMVTKIFTQAQVPSEVSGPIGIVAQAYEMNILSQGWLGTLRYAALLSINLAIMNLLPIPALDGGRAVFVLLESLLGKERRLRWERNANNIGLPFLLLLILLISIKDVFAIIW